MKDPKGILKRVLRQVKPSKKEIEREQKVAKELIEKITAIEGRHAEVVLAGSLARNTHLKGDRDIDVFVLFPKELSDKEFGAEGIRIAKKALKGHKWEKAYAQHPYIRGRFKGFDVEIVPSYRIESTAELKSAVDRTPFHTSYLQKKLKEKQKDEVRLLRQFLKGIKCYGADLKFESFPGYITELLIVKYGSFLKALKEISQWRKGTVIFLEKQFSEKKAREKFDSPLIIVDPTDEKRNVAAALSLNQFSRLVAAAQKFLEKPSINFFFEKPVKPWQVRKVKETLKKKELVCVKMPFPKVLPDLVWGQLRRLRKKLEKELELKEFSVIRGKEWSNDKDLMAILIELENVEIQKVHKRAGPEITDTKNSKRFLEAHKKIEAGPRIEKGRWVIEVKRKHWNAMELMKEYLKTQKKAVQKNIRKALKRAKVLNEKEIVELYKKHKDFAEFLTRYLKGKEAFLDY